MSGLNAPENAEKRKALCMMLLAIVATKGSIPSGHLWAEVQDKVHDLADYMMLVSILESAKWVTQRGHLITATAEGKRLGDKVKAEVVEGGMDFLEMFIRTAVFCQYSAVNGGRPELRFALRPTMWTIRNDTMVRWLCEMNGVVIGWKAVMW